MTSRPRTRIADWAVWSLPRTAIMYIVVIDVAAGLALVVSCGHGFSSNAEVGRALLLFAMVVIYGEACDRIERLNRYLAVDSAVSNQNSALCFAGVLVLPVNLAALLAVAVYLHTRARSRRWRPSPPHRGIFSTATTVLATFAAAGVLHTFGADLSWVGPREAAAVLLAMAAYTAVNLAVLMGCLTLVTGAPLRQLLPSRQDVAYENSTLLFGAFAGVVVLHAPWLSPLILLLLAILHRASLVADLQHRARTDPKTGLLNAGGWQLLARQHLLQCSERRSPAAVLLVDLDHFKTVNDTYGHLVGDQVLQQVAEVLMRELRGYDAVGRYGGEEFIALLPGVSDAAALAIGDRVRQRIATGTAEEVTTVTASVGVAVGHGHTGPSLEDIIDAADSALYEAKTAGRNQVRLASPVQVRGPRLIGQPDRRMARSDIAADDLPA